MHDLATIIARNEQAVADYFAFKTGCRPSPDMAVARRRRKTHTHMTLEQLDAFEIFTKALAKLLAAK